MIMKRNIDDEVIEVLLTFPNIIIVNNVDKASKVDKAKATER